jgi:hypothetical protein
MFLNSRARRERLAAIRGAALWPHLRASIYACERFCFTFRDLLCGTDYPNGHSLSIPKFSWHIHCPFRREAQMEHSRQTFQSTLFFPFEMYRLALRTFWFTYFSIVLGLVTSYSERSLDTITTHPLIVLFHRSESCGELVALHSHISIINHISSKEDISGLRPIAWGEFEKV